MPPPVEPVSPPPVEPVSPPVEPVSPEVEPPLVFPAALEGASVSDVFFFVTFFGGRNGSLGSKVSSEEPRSMSVSASFTLASAFRSLGSGALRTAWTGAEAGVAGPFESTTGTATSATARTTATGTSRFA